MRDTTSTEELLVRVACPFMQISRGSILPTVVLVIISAGRLGENRPYLYLGGRRELYPKSQGALGPYLPTVVSRLSRPVRLGESRPYLYYVAGVGAALLLKAAVIRPFP